MQFTRNYKKYSIPNNAFILVLNDTKNNNKNVLSDINNFVKHYFINNISYPNPSLICLYYL